MVISTRALAISATGLIAIVAGTVGYAHAHPAVADNPPAVYGLDPASPPVDPAETLISQQSRRVTANFSDVPVGRVLDWLAKQDANFVVSSSSVPSDLKITLHVKDQSLESVEHAIATAMGGTWTKRDGILVFNKGMFGAPFAIANSGTNLFSDKDLKSLKSLPGVQYWASPDGKQFELRLKDLQNQFGPEFQKKMQDQFGPEFQKKMQDQFGPEFQKKLQDQFGPEFQKKMQDQFGPEFQKKLQDQFGPEFQKKLQEEYQSGKGGAFGKVNFFRSQDLNGLMASLTDDQKAMMKKRGYLTPKDLNDKQLKMLGPVNGKFEVKIQSDKGSMTIKSE